MYPGDLHMPGASTTSPCHMVINDHLQVFLRAEVCPCRVVPKVRAWINTDGFPVTLVLEHKPGCIVGNDLKACSWVRRVCVRVPVIKRKVTRFWKELSLQVKDSAHCSLCQPVAVVDVAGDFLTFTINVPDEDNRR